MDFFSQSAENDATVGVLTVLLMLSPIVIITTIGILAYALVSNSKKKRQTAWETAARRQGFRFSATQPATLLQRGSYSQGKIYNVTEGKLSATSNPFVVYEQSETRGSGKSRHVYNRTVIRVGTPDLRAQFVINSKLNSMADSGGNLDAFHKEQKTALESSFSEFFDVYAPDTEKGDALVLLPPNVLEFILHQFAAYDIELMDGELFVYAYKPLDPTTVYSLLPFVDELVRKMRLRVEDTRLLRQTGVVNLVARTGADNTERKHLRRGPVTWSLLSIGMVFVASLLPSDLRGGVYVIYLIGVGICLAWSRHREAKLNRRYEQVVKRSDENIK